VIELEQDRISLAAVDTRMGAQVFEKPNAVLVAVAAHPRDFPRDVTLAIA
jgi:hypothetical protein